MPDPEITTLEPVLGAVPAAAAPVELAANKRLGIVGILSVVWLVGITLAAILAPILPLSDPKKPFLELKNGLDIAGPGTSGHPLGGDGAAHDLLARVVWGARASLLIGFCAVIIGLLIGGLLGLMAGYFRGRVDTVLSAAFDTLLAIPAIVMALALVAVLAPNDPLNPVTDTRRLVVLIAALGVVSIPVLARITRASTLAWAQREFVLAARAIGARNGRIIRREILPNVLPAMLSIALLGVAVVIVAEAGLAIIGAGVNPEKITWGNTIQSGISDLTDAPNIVLAPSFVIFITVMALNVLGDVVRAKFDVRESAL